ncbi:RidA family protein [Thermopolyspora sp. NPDC052614]|uniref:RidA family protein n=1 Tax=Thermopolyspora sp. NPDC052614 TaxID=3155682 RepID=UPI00343DE410
MIRRWSPADVPAPLAAYNHLAAVPADHELVVFAGQVGTLADGTLAGPDAESQARQSLANIEALLDSLNAGPANLVKLFTLVAGAEHLPGLRAALGDVLARWFPDGDVPPNTLAIVAGLATPEIVVEIEATAAVPTR